MAAPTTRCPFKVNATTNAGITCENTNCIAYDIANESCKLVMAAEKTLSGLTSKDKIADNVNNS